MGQFLMPATVPKSVADGLSHLSQFRTTLRHCASSLSPFRGKALTGAVLREGCWRENQTVASRASFDRWIVVRSRKIGVWRRRSGVGPRCSFGLTGDRPAGTPWGLLFP